MNVSTWQIATWCFCKIGTTLGCETLSVNHRCSSRWSQLCLFLWTVLIKVATCLLLQRSECAHRRQSGLRQGCGKCFDGIVYVSFFFVCDVQLGTVKLSRWRHWIPVWSSLIAEKRGAVTEWLRRWPREKAVSFPVTPTCTRALRRWSMVYHRLLSSNDPAF